MNILKIKSFELAILCEHLSQKLIADKRYNLSDQLFRAGTSIGANIAESTGSESRNDFAHKLSIALKEARELDFWLDLINEILMIEIDEIKKLNYEIQAILVASIKTAKKKKEVK